MEIPRCTTSHAHECIYEVWCLYHKRFQSYTRYKLKIHHFHQIKAHNSRNTNYGSMKIPRCTTSHAHECIYEVWCPYHKQFQSYARHKISGRTDVRTDVRTDGQRQIYMPPPTLSGGGIKKEVHNNSWWST
jgi:hypothetical protein